MVDIPNLQALDPNGPLLRPEDRANLETGLANIAVLRANTRKLSAAGVDVGTTLEELDRAETRIRQLLRL